MAREKAKEKRRGDERKRRDPGVPHPEIRNGMNARTHVNSPRQRDSERERARVSDTERAHHHTTTNTSTSTIARYASTRGAQQQTRTHKERYVHLDMDRAAAKANLVFAPPSS